MQQLFLYGVPFGVIHDSYSRIEDCINWSMVGGAQIRAVVVFQAQLGLARPIGLGLWRTYRRPLEQHSVWPSGPYMLSNGRTHQSRRGF
jgi:hypothetical protein